ncbi:MND1 [Candida oxycetoniae]|uniref:Meiotic nuclear division protein 1 n=1 Tax=Candida oxycetoniae TaxID=497107 RepID=A0AAI9WZ25_9ASCO|nr:MND1 [Candida oxycetoniae]KAI3405932.2 MND1 [Candida oxycetoniae]
MAPKKGQSQEEKIAALYKWFQSSHEFYTLKEIEQKGSKACKISSMQIKEFVASLVNDGLVQQEKCGTTNLYWSFKYSEHKSKQDKIDRLKKEVALKEETKRNLQDQVAKLMADTSVATFPEREAELERLHKLKLQMTCLQEKLKIFKDVNKIESIKQSIEFLNESTEGILYYLMKKTGIDQRQIRKEFDIPLDLEDPPTLSTLSTLSSRAR